VEGPSSIEAVVGVSAIPVRVGLVTVKTALAVMLPEAALMVALPGAAALASPLDEIVAAAVLLLDQVTVAVQLELVLFE